MTTNRMALSTAARIEAVANDIGVPLYLLACYASYAKDHVVVQVHTVFEVDRLAEALSWVEMERDERHPAEPGRIEIAGVRGVYDGVLVRVFGRITAEVTS